VCSSTESHHSNEIHFVNAIECDARVSKKKSVDMSKPSRGSAVRASASVPT
jgi:hypothetical protein